MRRITSTKLRVIQRPVETSNDEDAVWGGHQARARSDASTNRPRLEHVDDVSSFIAAHGVVFGDLLIQQPTLERSIRVLDSGNANGSPPLSTQQQQPPATVSAQPETKRSLGDVDDSFWALSKSFKDQFVKNGKGCDPSISDIDKHLRSKEATELKDVAERGSENLSFLHFLLRAPEQFKERVPLIKWAMHTCPQLYLVGVESDQSIMHLAAKRCKAAPEKEYLSSLINMYPGQLAEILEKSRSQEELLRDVIPFIRSSAPPEFLEFLGELPEAPHTEKCDCRLCKLLDMAEEGGAMHGQGDSLMPGDGIVSESVGDIVTLRWKAKASPERHQTARMSLTPTKMDSSSLAFDLPGNAKPADTPTPLHLAAEYRECDPASLEKQFNLVKHLFYWSKEWLKRTDQHGHSPYLRRVVGLGSKGAESDDMTFFLKDQIMHLDDRDLVLDLLYGKPQPDTRQVTTPASEQLAFELQHRRHEREIHLDLREIQISAPSSARQDLTNFIGALEFEDILQYVQIPRYPFNARGASRPSADASETKPGTNGAGRRDFDEIFKVLATKRVRKIIRLIVDDDDTCPHQDDVIERLNKFDVEEFQWRKMDVSSVILRHAVPRVRTLRLFSSGNHAVLREWSSPDGLNRLRWLECLHVSIYWRAESERRTTAYAKEFIERMRQNCSQIRELEVRLEPLTPECNDDWPRAHSSVTTHKWLQTMQRFASFVALVRKLRGLDQVPGGPGEARAPKPSDGVRVAILDDGIDWYFANQHWCVGQSFYADRSHDFGGRKAWYCSTTDHGTLMAALIRKICPNAKLYVARLDQTESEDGVPQPTPDSAAKAIRWAIRQRVHVISMSWTIPGTHPDLTKAVNEAHDNGILMFGAASDQGANSSEKPYMAKMSNDKKGPVICIGGAKEEGYGDDKAWAEAEFFFPGQTHGIPEPLPALKYNFGRRIGSSVATALAAGLTALIMLLVEMSPTYGGTGTESKGRPSYRDQLQDPAKIRRIFRYLLTSPEGSRPGAQRNDAIISVPQYFKPDKLSRRLRKTFGSDEAKAQKGVEMLDEVLNKVLRELIDDQKEWIDERSGSDTDGDGE